MRTQLHLYTKTLQNASISKNSAIADMQVELESLKDARLARESAQSAAEKHAKTRHRMVGEIHLGIDNLYSRVVSLGPKITGQDVVDGTGGGGTGVGVGGGVGGVGAKGGEKKKKEKNERGGGGVLMAAGDEAVYVAHLDVIAEQISLCLDLLPRRPDGRPDHDVLMRIPTSQPTTTTTTTTTQQQQQQRQQQRQQQQQQQQQQQGSANGSGSGSGRRRQHRTRRRQQRPV
jgi:hypothetical protein